MLLGDVVVGFRGRTFLLISRLKLTVRGYSVEVFFSEAHCRLLVHFTCREQDQVNLETRHFS